MTATKFSPSGAVTPDFARNLIAGLIGLIRQGDLQRAESTLLHAGGLLRSDSDTAENSALKDECRRVEHYLALQAFRFGNRLTCTVRFDGDIADLAVRRDILLNAAAAAVTRRLESTVEPVHLDIAVRRRRDGRVGAALRFRR